MLKVVSRKWFWLACIDALALKEKWAILVIFLHKTGILKARNQRRFPLDPCVCDCANFFAVKVVPSSPTILAKKWHDRLCFHEVHERIAHIAFVLKINR